MRHDLQVWADAWSAQLVLQRVAATQRTPAERGDAAAHYVATLAVKSRLELDYAAARQVEIAPMNVVTRRFLGFGGGMLAAPTLTPLWDWVPLWRASRRELP